MVEGVEGTSMANRGYVLAETLSSEIEQYARTGGRDGADV
jgi:hypothetical protein